MAVTAEEIERRRRLAELYCEHRALDEQITRRSGEAVTDELAMRRLKKRKLWLKDTIVHLQMTLVPDVPA